MAIEGKIVRGNGDLVGTYRADENAITLDIPDAALLARFKDGLHQEWAVRTGSLEGKVLHEQADFKRPTGLPTLPHFNEMVLALGYMLDDPKEVE